MNRWEAVVEIIRSFNERGRPGYALTALFVIALSALTAVGLASFGAMGLGGLVKLFG